MLTKLLQSPCSGELFEHFEQCSDITHCFTCCSTTVWTVFGHAILPFHVFEQCLNSLPCGGVLFEHFKQCSNCTLMPTTRGESFLFLFSFSSSLFFCLQPFTSTRKRIHARPSATRPHAHPPALKTSESCLFLSFSFFLYSHPLLHARTSAHPSARSEPISKCFFLFFFFLFVYSHPHPHVHTAARPSACPHAHRPIHTLDLPGSSGEL